MNNAPLTLPKNPVQWIAGLDKPSWDTWFMSMVFLAAMRSNDQQTKQGALIVDWPTKAVIGLGYNGHPRGADGNLPTMRAGSVKHSSVNVKGKTYLYGDCIPAGPDRDEAMAKWPGTIQGNPDKYVYMCHCETNALMSVSRPSNNAVLYIPMPSCEACGALVLNHPTVKINRIVYYEDRNLRNHIYSCRPDVIHEKWDTNNLDPADLLERAAIYIRLRKAEGEALSAQSTRTYR